jgi:hypothetical protein
MAGLFSLNILKHQIKFHSEKLEGLQSGYSQVQSSAPARMAGAAISGRPPDLQPPPDTLDTSLDHGYSLGSIWAAEMEEHGALPTLYI